MFINNLTDSHQIAPAARGAGSSWYIIEIMQGKYLVAKANLHRQGFWTFNPEFQTRVNRFGKQVTALRPLFPGYMFVNCSLADGRWRAIRSTLGVKRFAGPAGAIPAPVRQSLVDELMARCPEGVLDPAIGELQIGQQVRLEDCAFSGAFAEVHRLDDAGRVRVLISLLGAERLVSVPRSAVRTV